MQGVSIGGGRGVNLGVHGIGVDDVGGDVGPLRGLFRLSRFGVAQGLLRVGQGAREPVGDGADAECGQAQVVEVCRCRLGEGASLGDGGDVGPVDGQDRLEDVAGLGEVAAVGDDVERVVVAAAGGGDVQAAAGGGW